jgi:hypothetical protein
VKQIYGGILQIVALHAIKRPQIKISSTKYQISSTKYQIPNTRNQISNVWAVLFETLELGPFLEIEICFFGILSIYGRLCITVSIKHATPAGNDYYCMY